MSIARRNLEQELADVAAGTRDRVSLGTSGLVTYEEERAAFAQRTREEGAARAAETHSARAADAAEKARDAQRDSAALNRKALDVQREMAHEARDHAAKLERTAERTLEFQRRAHEAQMEAAEEVEQAADASRQRAQKDRRLQTSLTYAAVLKLLEFRRLDSLIQEGKEFKQLLSPLQKTFAKFELAVHASDAAQENYAVDRQRAAAAIQCEMESHATALKAKRADLKTTSATFNPATWWGPRAVLRKQYRQEHTALEKLVSKSTAALAELKDSTRPAQSRTAVSAIQSPRLKKVMEICRALDIEAVLENTRQKLDAWFELRTRSPEISRHFERKLVEREEEIDYDVCVMLDHLRASGMAEITHPKYGLLPSGPALAELLMQIEQLKQNLPRYALDEEQPRALVEMAMLESASKSGLFPGGPADDAYISLGNFSKDPFIQQAAEIVVRNRKASISLIQRELKIGYNRGASLMEGLENAGVVGPIGRDGQRAIRVT